MRRRRDDGRRPILATAGLALALLVTAAGCGDPLAEKLEGSGKQPYSDDDPALADARATPTTVSYRQVVTAVGIRMCTIADQSSFGDDGDDAALVAQVRGLEAALRQVATDLEAVEVPDGAAALHVADAAIQARTAADHYALAAVAAGHSGFQVAYPGISEALHFFALSRYALQDAGAPECPA